MGWPTNFAAWIERIKKWLDVPDLADDVFGFCLDSANERLNRDLNSQWMESSYEYVVIDGEPIDIRNEITDFNRVRLVSVRGYKPLIAVALNEYRKEVIENTSITPRVYCISGMQLYIWPLPAVDSTIDIDYYVKVPALSSTNSSNIFAEKHPDALLYAALLEATPYITEDERLNTWSTFYNNIREAINVTADRANKGSSPLTREIKVMR